MNEEQLKIRDKQRETWNKFSPGWEMHDEFVMKFLKPCGDEMISCLQLKRTDYVLDIASGTGEPGLTIARIVLEGNVTGADLSEGMLMVARKKAAQMGIGNYTIKVCDASELSFADNSFNAVCCRMGFMFFPDMQMALKEIYRVLKPGGRFATAVWSAAPNNEWISLMMRIVGRNLNVDPPKPGAPGMFRCAPQGLMMNLLKESGFKNISEKLIQATANYETPDKYWKQMMEVAAPVVAVIAKADEATKQKVKDEVYNELKAKYPDGNVNIGSEALVICGEK
jgi:ubiquinone/menaquinone biosynthesis C-methylase UbiE